MRAREKFQRAAIGVLLCCASFLSAPAYAAGLPTLRDIPWTFTVHDAPAFAEPALETFRPQPVWVRAERADGWALIDTYLGRKWAFFSEEANAARAALDAYMAEAGTGAAVYFEQPASGYVYSHNADALFFAASLTKAPYAWWRYSLADAGAGLMPGGNADRSHTEPQGSQLTVPPSGASGLNTAHVLSDADLAFGAEPTRRVRCGGTYTEAELLRLMIAHSDNAAFSMLLRRFGTADFKDFIEEAGGRTGYLNALTNAMVSARDIGFYARKIYDYIETPGTSGETLREHMLAAERQYIVSDHPAANKYGLWDGACHDMAIVYADTPYILAVLTDRGDAKGKMPAAVYELFAGISQRAEALNTAVSATGTVIN